MKVEEKGGVCGLRAKANTAGLKECVYDMSLCVVFQFAITVNRDGNVSQYLMGHFREEVL
jgi:hypothetical protein